MKARTITAYDRVDWFFLEGLLRKHGFHEKWIKWIMDCVTTVKFCVQVNGNITEDINPTRGPRQGDPLSPYLFLFVTDSLSKVIQKAVLEKELEELKIGKIGFLPKSSRALDYLPIVDCTLVKYPLRT
jgi:hypothetical protein